MPEITKNQLKHVRLLKQKKHRMLSGQFVVEGEKNVEELIHSQLEIVALFATKDWTSPSSKYSPILVTNKELSQMSGLSSPNKVLAVAKIPEVEFSTSSLQEGITLVLNEINDPGNLGTIIRTADWFGIKQIICSPNSVDCYNPKVVQSTKGSIAQVTIHYLDISSVLDSYNLPVFAADMEGTKMDKNYRFPKDCIIMMGSESHGIPEELSNYITDRVTIPKVGQSESLNVAIATSIILHHSNL